MVEVVNIEGSTAQLYLLVSSMNGFLDPVCQCLQISLLSMSHRSMLSTYCNWRLSFPLETGANLIGATCFRNVVLIVVLLVDLLLSTIIYLGAKTIANVSGKVGRAITNFIAKMAPGKITVAARVRSSLQNGFNPEKVILFADAIVNFISAVTFAKFMDILVANVPWTSWVLMGVGLAIDIAAAIASTGASIAFKLGTTEIKVVKGDLMLTLRFTLMDSVVGFLDECTAIFEVNSPSCQTCTDGINLSLCQSADACLVGQFSKS